VNAGSAQILLVFDEAPLASATLRRQRGSV